MEPAAIAVPAARRKQDHKKVLRVLPNRYIVFFFHPPVRYMQSLLRHLLCHWIDVLKYSLPILPAQDFEGLSILSCQAV